MKSSLLTKATCLTQGLLDSLCFCHSVVVKVPRPLRTPPALGYTCHSTLTRFNRQVAGPGVENDLSGLSVAHLHHRAPPESTSLRRTRQIRVSVWTSIYDSWPVDWPILGTCAAKKSGRRLDRASTPRTAAAWYGLSPPERRSLSYR